MSEYIDVNRLKEDLVREIYFYTNGDTRKRLFARGLSVAYDIVNRQPTVEPKESVLVVAKDEWKNIKQSVDDGDVSMIVIGDTVFRKGEVEKQGYWIEKPLPSYESLNGTQGECSVCHETSLFYTNYCPNCGAKMIGEDDE